MAYNTRRGGGGGGGYMTSTASVGQRRPGGPNQLGNNFTPGGQLAQPNKPNVQMAGQQQGQRQPPNQQNQQQKQQVQLQKPPIVAQRQQQVAAQQQQQNLRQQAQQFLNQQQPPTQQQPSPQQQQQQPPQQQKPPQQQQQNEPKIVFQSDDKAAVAAAIVATPPSLLDTTNGDDVSGDANSVEGGDRKPRRPSNKPFWMRKEGRINKKERLRRRNMRLRKILQPKNALMVLHELIGSAPYNLSENPDLYEGSVFRCSVQVDGMEHVGVGKSKPAAKTAAAETALKHMVLSKLKTAQSLESSLSSIPPGSAQDSDGDIKMDIDSEDTLGGISWSHVACYALHKLLSSWDEGTNLAEKLVQAAAGGASISTNDAAKTFEKKPAKKLPESANSMNPIMLLNQMHPSATYEEVSKTGNPPNVRFTIKCIVAGESFIGSGSTKKVARKMCAFAACRKILGIEYTPAFLEENGFAEDAVTQAPAAPEPMA